MLKASKICLVVSTYPSEKYDNSSVGIMKLLRYGKIIQMFQTTNKLPIVSPADGICFIHGPPAFSSKKDHISPKKNISHLLPSKSHGSSYKAGLAGLWSSPLELDHGTCGSGTRI